MSDFVLEITGAGSAITLEPVGLIDGEGAKTLLDAVGSLRYERAALVQLSLDRVTGLTDDGWRVLATSELPVEVLATSRRAFAGGPQPSGASRLR